MNERKKVFHYPSSVTTPRLIIYLFSIAGVGFSLLIMFLALLGGSETIGNRLTVHTEGTELIIVLMGFVLFLTIQTSIYLLYPSLSITEDGIRLTGGLFRSALIKWDDVTEIRDVKILARFQRIVAVVCTGLSFPFNVPLRMYFINGSGFLISEKLVDFDEAMLLLENRGRYDQ